MRWPTRLAVTWATAVVVPLAIAATATADADAFLTEMAAKASRAAADGTTVVRGSDGWLYFAPELRSLGVGKFWGDAAENVSRASKPEYADPAPAILDFKEQLDRAGIELIFVPVPAKAAVYPDGVSGQVDAQTAVVARVDRHHQEFYELLRERGVRVVDLTPVYLGERRSEVAPLYCRQDTHWSGRGCGIAAKEIARVIHAGGWVADVPTRDYDRVQIDTRIAGDLWVALDDPNLPKEDVPLVRVRPLTATLESPADNEWRDSPVLLFGDSHCLVFHAGGDMHARGSGLADHLAGLLGFAPDVVGVRGSGATPSRLALFRRGDSLAGKRVVVWCMSVREFTEGQGWRKVPVIR